MRPPYEPEEIAIALIEAAQRAGRRVGRVEVMPDTKAGTWVIRVQESGGGMRRLIFPFASARGIYTPVELGERFVRGDWPF